MPAPVSAPIASPQPSLGGRPAANNQEAADIVTRSLPPARTPLPTTPAPPANPSYPYSVPGLNAKGQDESDIQAENQRNENNTKITDSQILAEQAKGMNDSINAQFGAALKSQQDKNADTEARTLVLNSAAGNTGGGTGSAAIEKERTVGNAALDKIRQGQTGAIQKALATTDTLRSNQMKAEQAQQQNDTKTYQSLRATNQKAALDSLTSFANGNVDLEKLKTSEPQTYASLQKELGLSDLEMTAKYNALKGAKATKYQYKVTGDTITAYGVDANGNLTTQEETVPGLSAGKYTIKQTTDGALYKINTDTGEVTTIHAASGKNPATTSYSKNQESDAKNWLALQPGFDSKKDYAAFDSDPAFKAWAIEQSTAAKPSKTKTAKSAGTSGADLFPAK